MRRTLVNCTKKLLVYLPAPWKEALVYELSVPNDRHSQVEMFQSSLFSKGFKLLKCFRFLTRTECLVLFCIQQISSTTSPN